MLPILSSIIVGQGGTVTRGRGLLLGIVLTAEAAKPVEVAARDAGFLVNAPAPNVIRLAPPLVISAAQVDDFLAAFPAVLEKAVALKPDEHDVNQKDIQLTVTEFLLVKALAQRPGMVKSRDQLIDAAYGENVYVDDRTIDSHVKRLRKKFRNEDGEFDQIETLYGIGYRYKDI